MFTLINDFFKKTTAHAFFLSLLAGKFQKFERWLYHEQKMHTRLLLVIKVAQMKLLNGVINVENFLDRMILQREQNRNNHRRFFSEIKLLGS